MLSAALTEAASRDRGVVHLAAELPNRTRWAEDLGEHTARRLADLHDRIARSLMKKHQGRQVAPSGQYLMRFGRADDALGFALAYFRALDRLSQGGAIELVSGVGIHHGEDGAQGREIARRLAARAGHRRILLTREAFDLARPLLEAAPWLGWQAYGRVETEGDREPLEVVEVQVPELGAEDPLQ